jgi:hypothetical protein
MSYWQPGNKLTAAKLNGQPGRIPVGAFYRSTPSGSIATRTAIATTDQLALEANTLYHVTYYSRIASVAGTGTVSVTVDLRTNNASGTILNGGASAASNSGTATVPPYVVTGWYQTTAAENTAFCGTLSVTASGGGAGGTANVGTYVVVEKILPLNGVVENG